MCTFISGAREGVARGLALSSQLFDFTKQRDFQARSADANELLKALEVFLRYGAGSEVRLLLELSPNIPNCLIDPSQFNAAVLNLVLNARDAMAQGGEIQISTEPCVIQGDDSDITPRTYVRVRVKDNGSGMPDAVLEKIFEPFFTTKGEKGTGLGIPQVGAFIRYLGGEVCVASEVGCGTTFDMFFPTVQQTLALPSRLASLQLYRAWETYLPHRGLTRLQLCEWPGRFILTLTTSPTGFGGLNGGDQGA